MSLTKADLVDKVYKALDLSKKDSTQVVELLFKVIKQGLVDGEGVKISGFGNFLVKEKHSRMGRNPQKGTPMEISARRVLTFKPSQILRDDITDKYCHRLDEQGNEDHSLGPKEIAEKALKCFHY